MLSAVHFEIFYLILTYCILINLSWVLGYYFLFSLSVMSAFYGFNAFFTCFLLINLNFFLPFLTDCLYILFMIENVTNIVDL